MAEDLRLRIQLLCAAFRQRNTAVIADALADDVQFHMHAPPELFSYLGHRNGKAAMMDAIRSVIEEFEFETYDPISIVVDQNATASIILSRARERASLRPVQALIVQFVHFKNGKIVEFRQFMDSLDVVQQLLDRKFDLSR